MVVIFLTSDLELKKSSIWLTSVFYNSFYLIPIFFFINRSSLGFNFSACKFNRVWEIGFDKRGVKDWTNICKVRVF